MRSERPSRASVLVAALVLAAATACSHGICSRSSDCSTGLVCSALGRCEVQAEVDAGTGSGNTIAPQSDAAIDAAIDAAQELPPDADDEGI